MSNQTLSIINNVSSGKDEKVYRPMVRDLVRTSCTNSILLRDNKDMYSSKPYDVYVPCGECENCRNNKANQLFSRMYIAAKELQNAYFITLTYNSYDKPEDIPYQHLDSIWHYDNLNGKRRFCWRPCLIQYNHFQDYIKKLRVYLEREYGHSVTLLYYCGAEYGSTYGSPHFHIILLSNEKIPQTLLRKSWMLDGHSCGRVQIDDLFENGTMLGVQGYGNAKKCFKYCAKYAGKGKPMDFNTTRVKLAYDYFFKEEMLPEPFGYTVSFNNTDTIVPIQLQKCPESQLNNLIDKIWKKKAQLERADKLKDKCRFSSITRERNKFTYWSNLSSRYFEELRQLNIEYNKNKRICYVSKKNYAMDENSTRFGVPEKVLHFYNENRLNGFIRRCNRRGYNPIINEDRLYYKSRQEFVPLSFRDFCSIYRQSGHISTGSALKNIYLETYAERVAEGNKRMPKANICSLSSTATERNSQVSLQFPNYFKLLETKEKLPFVIYCKTLKQATTIHKISYKDSFQHWLSLYNAAIAYRGYLPINHYDDLTWEHISQDGEPSISTIIGYTALVGPYKNENYINTLSIKSSNGVFDSYIHSQPVVSQDVQDITFSSLYNRETQEYYRLVIGRTEDGLTDVKFAVYQYDKKYRCNVFRRYETFMEVFYSIDDQFDNYRKDWDVKRAYMDINTQFHDIIRFGKDMTEDNLEIYKIERETLEKRDYYKAISPAEKLPIDSIYNLTKEYAQQVEENNQAWSRFHKEKEIEHYNKNKVC